MILAHDIQLRTSHWHVTLLHGMYGSVSLSAGLVGKNTKATGTLSAHSLKQVIISFLGFLCFSDTTTNLLVWNDGLDGS